MKRLKHTSEILARLDFSERLIAIESLDGYNNNHSFNSPLVETLTEIGIDKIYLSGQFPTVYFKQVQSFADETCILISTLHKKIWNERKASFLFVSSPVELRIYNCFAEPINPRRQLEKLTELELFSIDISESSLVSEEEIESKLEELIKVFSRSTIDSGFFWKERKYAIRLDSNRRVDKALMKNLKEIRAELIKSDLKKVDVIHDLLLRSLFILYLEDRKATTTEFYGKYKEGATSYFDILSDLKATYDLFDKLEKSFNGNLCPVTDDERKAVRPEHLALIKECFWSNSRQGDGQMVLFDWRIFDFSVIRIELISEIYEEFLSTEQGESQTRKDGAYYTPHSLVDFILNEKLPWLNRDDNNYGMKILDPTCGSGIFLVEAFKRIVNRWKYINRAKEIDFSTLKKLLLNSIFGVELNSDAIKVAAFSLYLALLNYLNPRTLWQDKKFPYLIYDPSNKDNSRQGKNLFRMSSLSGGPFSEIKFDLIVGNPPFKRGNLPIATKEYLSKRGYAQEDVLAFLDRATHLCPNGQIALVATSKILFNKTSGYSNFRRFLFNENYVEAVYNFSALRKAKREFGGSLFASAVGPACVIFYQKEKPEQLEDKILYCTPKTLVKNRLVDGVAIDAFDMKYIPRKEASNPDSKIWKISMWGTERDFLLIKKLSKLRLLKDELKRLEKENWHKGVGFQISDPCDKPNSSINKIPHIDAELIERYYTLKSSTKDINYKKFRRFGTPKAYIGPHVLIKEGQSNKRFCASFLDYDCSFRDTVYGISSDNSKLLKALTAYLNSAFSSYFLFLTASTWGVERERVKPNEILELPALPFFIESTTVNQLSKKVDEIIRIKKKEFLDINTKLYSIEQEIDDIVFKALNLSTIEKSHIFDVINYSLDLFQEGENSAGYKPVSNAEMENYSKWLCSSLNNFLEDRMYTSVSIPEISSKSPLALVVLKFSQRPKEISVERTNTISIPKLLKQIDDYTYEKHSESIYFRKVIKYYDRETIYLIKPNEKRFWSRSTAINDADDITLEVLNLENA